MGEAERPVSSQDGAHSPAHDRPESVLSVSPQEGATASPTSSVSAALRVAPEEGVDPTEVTRFTLSVDDEDVTAACRLRETMTFPRGRLEITFVPGAPWRSGEHNAEVGWQGASGDRDSYGWSFTVIS